MFKYFADLVVFDWLGLPAGDPFTTALNFFVYGVPKISVLMTVAVFVVSIIRSYIPPEKTKKYLSHRRTFVGNILAALIGILTPFCSCSAVPLFIGFMEAGVPLGVTFSFLVSSPMINEVGLIMLLGMFGWKVALLYVISGVVIAIISGYVIGKLKLEHLVEDYVYQIKSSDVELHEPTFAERCREAKKFTADFVKRTALYIAGAMAVGGFIHGYVPSDFLTTYAGRNNPLAVPLVVLIGVPMYNSVAGMVPIVYALMEKGLPLGTSLAFLMSVAALSLPEMIILRRVLKVKLIAIYVSVLTVAIILTGYLFNAIV
ncbi:Putative two-component membrane permease complex subunit [Sporomusa silvacetica DSM 10669]|uniref:Two-component membrane permease complex subunit n=1 Tax=Sporomusa silvacetica DSM 10669 TaxID=1123289 RepID=A0ABZ3IPS5_9FIRM|nr:permease [Sporomusa silvacetica]OZC13795.1 putative two-component membrane permease complex subunit [Sporomusa silvacetica DSM 10669]